MAMQQLLFGAMLILAFMPGYANACSCRVDSSAEEDQIDRAFDDSRVLSSQRWNQSSRYLRRMRRAF